MTSKRLKWVWFTELECYYCYNKKEETELGLLEYNKSWKQWTWQQMEDIEMSWDCLQEVIDFIKKLGENSK